MKAGGGTLIADVQSVQAASHAMTEESFFRARESPARLLGEELRYSVMWRWCDHHGGQRNDPNCGHRSDPSLRHGDGPQTWRGRSERSCDVRTRGEVPDVPRCRRCLPGGGVCASPCHRSESRGVNGCDDDPSSPHSVNDASPWPSRGSDEMRVVLPPAAMREAGRRARHERQRGPP